MKLDENGNDMTIPWYGGNKIPQSYLDKFTPSKPEPEDQASLPFWIVKFAETL